MAVRGGVKRTLIALLTFALVACARGATPRAASPELIDEAIKKGADYLFSKQKNGNWEFAEKRDPTTKPYDYNTGGQWGGKTALVTYALLAADQSPQDQRIVQAVNWLRRAELVGTYAIGMRAQVWNNLPSTPENKASMERDSKLLLDLCKTDGDAKGFYTYLHTPDTKTYDHSASQYGVLGCWACADNLESFPPNYWAIVDRAWRADQHDDGSWSYRKQPEDKYPNNLPMTCAGVATLFVTQDFVTRGKPAENNGNPQDTNINKGFEYVRAHFKDAFAIDHDKSRDPYYTLYGVERIGLASGFKYFETTNWYQAGADYLVSKQSTSGSFSGGGYDNTISTCYALLFLSRGRAPITMNKVQYEVGNKEGNWNQRPRDLANLTRYIGKETERALNWQIVNLKAPVEELHDAPILYICGNQDLDFSDEQKQKLRQYVEQGGMILAQPDGASLKFAKSARQLGSDLFPQYEFRTLSHDHVIFTNQQFPVSKFKRKPNVLGISNGARELMILLPDDPARWWQPMDSRAHSDDFQLGADIFLYAIDKQNLLKKGQTYLVSADPKIKTTGTISVARLQYDGNWDPEPGGWKRLGAIMHNANHVELKVEPVKLAAGALKGKKIAHLTGTTQFKLDDAGQKEMKDFVTAGGTLIIDATAGNGQFAESVETQMGAIFGAGAKGLSEALPQDSPLYSAGGKPIEIAWRTYAKAQLGSLKGGRLRAMKVDDRLAVIYSPEDLSVGLVGQPIDGIVGYEPKTASALMANALMVASKAK
jgi:hypothetical protein